jgi:hypothetical protein
MMAESHNRGMNEHASLAVDMHTTTEEPLEVMFRVQSMPNLYSGGKQESWVMRQKPEIRVCS